MAADGATIKLGKKERVAIQKSLAYLGVYRGAFDGSFGRNTKVAIAAGRQKLGLSCGQEVDFALLENLPDVTAIDRLKLTRARRYKQSDIALVTEPRLSRAMKALSRYTYKFDYYEGRLYLAVMNGGNDGWLSASRLANKAGGHLVTITSSRENKFVYRLFSSDKRFLHVEDGSVYGPHIGLYQVKNSKEPRGGWRWVTEERLKYKNWADGNPDNYMGRQHWARFFRYKTSSHRTPDRWDDTSERWDKLGFIFEFE